MAKTHYILKELRKQHNWNLPVCCPLCGSTLISDPFDGNKVVCPNDNCICHTSGKIAKWVKTLDIKEIGEATIDDLVNDCQVNSLDKLYADDFAYIKKLYNKEGYGEKSINKIIDELRSHIEISLVKFIAGLNIGGISEKILEKSFKANNLKTINEVMSCKSFICDGVGETLSNKIYNGLTNREREIVELLKYLTVVYKEDKKTMGNGVLNGASFCFTGAASRPRKELQQMVIDNGGEVKSSIVKGLTYLVQADKNSTSTKSQKAKSLGVQLISEDEFVEMCQG